MKTDIYYYSSTGNALQTARDIANMSGESRLISISRFLQEKEKGKNEKSRVIGFVFPVHDLNMPVIVDEFVKQLDISRAEYIFAVAVCGGYAGKTLFALDTVLQQKGKKLDAGFIISQPVNFLFAIGAPGEKSRQKMFAKKKSLLPRITSIIRAEKSETGYKQNPLANAINNLLFKGVKKLMIRSDKNFRVSGNCKSCGSCAKVCPRKNITLKKGTPAWSGTCTMCLTCIQWCPGESIEYAKSTVGKKRYHHPQVTLSDFVLR